MSTFLLKRTFHTELCQRIIDEIQYQRSNYYYFLGKIVEWNAGDTPPIAISDDVASEMGTRAEIVSFKKIIPSDVSFVIPRIDWVYNTQYTQYDSTLNMIGLPFYVVTEEFNVYKCLDNAGVPSLNKPTGSSLTPQRTADGYLWKYMYTIAPYKRNKFVSQTRIPVQRALTDRFYNNGNIDGILITDQGAGYVDSLMTSITLTGGTVGAGGVIGVTIVAGSITGTSITSGGTGYTKGARIVIVGIGAGAELTPVIVGGIITGVTIVNPGAGYDSGSTGVTVVVGGAVAIPTVSRVTGSIEKVTIVDQGIGYATAPTLGIIGIGGIGKYTGNVTAILKPIVDGGKLVEITIEDPGLEYPFDNTTSVTVTGDGTGAEFTPVIYQGKIIDVITENSGTGYTFANITFNGSAIPALGTAIMSEADLLSDQSSIEQTAVDGAIYNIVVTNPGSEYIPGFTYVAISGDGDGATATVNIVNGEITSLNMTNIGSGYTYATVTITREVTIPGTIPAVAYPILSPHGGHGKDAVNELFGDSLCMFSNIRYASLAQSISQDFREYGMIKNIRDLYSGNIINTDYSLCAYTVTLNTTTGLVKDEILKVDNLEFRVVDFIQSTQQVILISITKKALSAPITLTAKVNSARSYDVLSISSTPGADKYSGQILFVSDSEAFTFTNEQEITIKTFITL